MISTFWAVKSLVVPAGPDFILGRVSNLGAAITTAGRGVNAIYVDGFDVLCWHDGKCSLAVAKRTAMRRFQSICKIPECSACVAPKNLGRTARY
jgi:hypothetical protein